MNWIAEDAISLLMFLAPGLVVVGIFRSLTSYPPPSVFDQVVQALIFTIIVQTACGGIVELFERIFGESDASWTTPYPPHLSFPIAVALAVLLAATYGNDAIHRRLRRLRITRETSFPSEWYSAFHRHQNCYVVLHLVDERFVYGWPVEWPGQPEKGHFKLSEYTWLTRDEVDGALILCHPEQDSYRESILIPVSEVVIVEFMRSLPEDE